MDPVKAPFLTYRDVSKKAEQFCNKYNARNEIPVPIEEIIELDFEMDVIPIPGLRDSFELDGFISSNLSEITVDNDLFENDKLIGRYRFTLAHELGHRILHENFIRNLQIHSIADIKDFYSGIEEDQYGWLEKQANWFAGLVLVPPENLEKDFIEVCSKLNLANLQFNALNPGSMETIYENLAQPYAVSSAVIECCLREQKLILE